MFSGKTITCCIMLVMTVSAEVPDRYAVEGYSRGFMSGCVDFEKDLDIPTKELSDLQFIVFHRHKFNAYPYSSAPEGILKNRHVDFENRKTLVFITGFLDSQKFLYGRWVGDVYAAKGDYNIILVETLTFTAHPYDTSARLSRSVGAYVGRVLARLGASGLDPSRLELVGFSLGAHVAGAAGASYRNLTGKSVSRITGLDPAGPCFRFADPSLRLDPTDAEFVDIVHTNGAAYGLVQPLGHVDYYVNGGEWQPDSQLNFPLGCLVLCSHVRASAIWIASVSHPKLFVATKCDTIEDAKFSNCSSSETALLGLEVDRSSRGLFYLNTTANFPFHPSLPPTLPQFPKETLEGILSIYKSVASVIPF